ncbi:MAG: hypothetical protein FWH42_01625 [Dehalococcoidia bacterium]|nr:hypothetical protein [Dehalococcoidia bacterium]
MDLFRVVAGDIVLIPSTLIKAMLIAVLVVLAIVVTGLLAWVLVKRNKDKP